MAKSISAKPRLVTPEATEEDRANEPSIRPSSLEDFVGQKRIAKILMTALSGCEKRGEPLGHVMFHAPPGLGKTTLARIIGGSKAVQTIGSSLTVTGVQLRVHDAMRQKNPVLFIDEFHNLKRSVPEVLNVAMEDFVLPDFRALRTKPFTLIGATTKLGKVSSPLRARFDYVFHLEFYEPKELAQILNRTKQILNLEASDGALLNISNRSRGTPRIANRFLRIMRDYSSSLDSNGVNRIFRELDIDKAGLDSYDRRILETIAKKFHYGPVGLSTLAGSLCEEEETLTEIGEPFLLRQGLLIRTPRGRVLTARGIKLLKGGTII